MSKRSISSTPDFITDDMYLSIETIKLRNADFNYKYHIITYGCQMNVHDSEKLSGMLEQMGYTQTSDKAVADLIIFNTCCVRDHAEQRVYGNIGMLKEQKQKKPNLLLAVCGCMMQQKGVSDTIAKKFPFVDLVFGTHNLHFFPELLQKALDSSHTVVDIIDEQENNRIIPIKRSNGVSAWVTVMYGCDNYCSYCVVPYVRGRERSRSRIEILDEINILANEGYKEIFLLGQNVNSFKGDNDYRFHNLLKDINEIEGIKRIRFISSHPKDLSDGLLDAFENCDKLCEQLHLPIQSGSNAILDLMNRKYSREDYLRHVEKIKGLRKKIALSTDIIVGFPGETDDNFEQTLSLMKEVKFDSAFTFMYSKRTGTPASEMKDQVDQETKKRRLEQLNRLQAIISKEINSELIGSVVELLVEGKSKSDSEIFSGRTRTNKIVNFKAESLKPGDTAKVKILSAKPWTLEAELV